MKTQLTTLTATLLVCMTINTGDAQTINSSSSHSSWSRTFQDAKHSTSGYSSYTSFSSSRQSDGWGQTGLNQDTFRPSFLLPGLRPPLLNPGSIQPGGLSELTNNASFVNMPLWKVLHHVRQRQRFEGSLLQVSERAWKLILDNQEAPITLSASNLSTQELLRRILAKSDLRVKKSKNSIFVFGPGEDLKHSAFEDFDRLTGR